VARPDSASRRSLARVELAGFQRQWITIRERALAAVDRVGESGWLILGREVLEFERALGEYAGVEHVVGCASGLDAIEIALRACGIGTGDRVLTTPLSAFATALAIIRAGAEPTFVDVDDTGLLDLDLADQALSRDARIRAVVPVHLYGHAQDLDALERLVARHGVVLVEDCAQAIGARSRGRAVGTVGRASATSFYPTKNLGALGDGGAVLTTDGEIDAIARVLRDYGQVSRYTHDRLGLNSRLDELHAAVMRDALLPELVRLTARRVETAERYRAEISSPHLTLPRTPPKSQSVWHLFPTLVEGHREAFRKHLRERGIDSAVHYPVLMSDQSALREAWPHARYQEMPVAHRFSRHEVSLPLHPYLEVGEIDRVIAACNQWRG
jgi:dTDP-3-amino-3,4,6-trideoxy-alpha-D-glucose transaminase